MRGTVARYSILALLTVTLASCDMLGIANDDGGSGSGGPPPKSKLSIHTADVGPNEWTIAFARDAQPTTIKLLGNDFSSAPEIKRVSPDTLIIGRAWRANNHDWEDLADEIAGETPEAAAQRWWDEYSPIILNTTGGYAGVDAVDAWEGPNEPVASGRAFSAEQMAWYGDFEAERVRILAENGLRAVIGNFTLGTPALPVGTPVPAGETREDPMVWPEFYPAIDAALANEGLLGLHEYATPMHKEFGLDSPHNWDLPPELRDQMGWLTGRYRRVYYHYLIPDNRVIPLVITEGGVDGYAGGWQAVPYTEDEYKAQLVWYDRVLQEDDYVIGMQIFAVDMFGWETFDLDPIMPWMIDYVGGDTSDLGNYPDLPPTSFEGTEIPTQLAYLHDGGKMWSSFQYNFFGWEPLKGINNAVLGGDGGVGFMHGNNTVVDADDDVRFMVELPAPAQIDRVELWPSSPNAPVQALPQAFTISISNDTSVTWDDFAPTLGDGLADWDDYNEYGDYGTDADWIAYQQAIEDFKDALTWTEVHSYDHEALFPGTDYDSADPYIFNLETPMTGKYVMITVTERDPVQQANDDFVQLSEIAVYGP